MIIHTTSSSSRFHCNNSLLAIFIEICCYNLAHVHNFNALICVNVWIRSHKYFYHLPIQPHVKITPPTPCKYIRSLVPNLTLGGMGKYKKKLHDLSQTVTDIRALKVMNMCKILSVYISPCKQNLWPKNWVTREPETGSTNISTCSL
jgi:hypothetical protein